MPLGSRCLILEQLVLVLDVKLVVSNCPSLFEMIFPNYLGYEDCVDSLFKTMMTNAFSNQSFIDWHKMWCDMLLTIAKACDKRLPAVERIIMHSANLSQEFLNLVLRENVPMSTKLAAMLTIRQVSLHREVQVLYKQQLNEALVGLDDHTRILALRFMVDMPRPSKCFGSDELDAIMLYLQHNANNPSAHIRQLGFGLLKKALQRIELNLEQHMKRPICGGEELLQFLTIFMAKLSYNLFPTANYGRRWISLRLLDLCVQICCRQSIPFMEKLPNVTVPYLENCLGDSYEHNKTHASNLLCKVSKKSRLQPVKIMEMLLSLRPPDSLTGAYQLQVYCQSVEVEEELPLLIDTTVYHPKTYKALMWCYKHLREGTFFAQQNLAEAAKMNPLYGLLCASRHLIMQLNMDKLAQELKWRQYIYELLDLCMTIIKVVLPIVSSSSPEGYLPASQYDKIKDMENANVLRRRLGAKTVQQLHTTPQMVLLCGWRSVKEIALILGELVQRAPLELENSDSFLLEKSQLSAIGDHFLMLLSETKHRGAFEQAYVGFTMLCHRFWLSDEVSLNQKPNLWVQEAMLMIEDSNQNLCLTRRSAGMPFILQALICTELTLGTHGTLYKTIFLLLNICERRTSSKESVVSRSHALNTLRVLYRCSELSDLVVEFVSRGVMCALGCLLADEWSERNSATLTLAAIIVRVFGVERARSYKGDFHIRNRMTGRVFFTRYPELFDFLYIGLKHAAVKINDQRSGNPSTEQTIQLEAMLLILCRLYPSSSEGSESSISLVEFVPFLKSITKSHDLVTRQRASQVIANFVSLHRSVDLIRKIIFHLIVLEHQLRREFLPLKSDYSGLRLDWNYLHGKILQLHHLYRVVRWTYPSLSRLVVHTLSQLAIQVCHCDIFVFIAIIDVLVTIMEDICDLNQINPLVMDVVFAVYRLNHDWIYKRCEMNATSPRSFAVFSLHLNRLIFTKKGMMQYLKDFMEQENLPPDIEQLQIDLWLYIMFQNNKNTSKNSRTNGLIDNFDIDFYRIKGDVAQYYDSFEKPLREEVTKIMLISKRIHISILKMRDNAVTGKYFSPKRACRLYALLGLLPKQTLTMDEILDHYLIDDSNEIQPGLVLSVIRLVAEYGIEQHQWIPVLSYTLRIANPSQTKYMRRKASQLCECLKQCISLQLSIGDVEIIGYYCRLVIILLADESDSVRNYMAQMVNKSQIFLTNSEILPSLAMPKFLNHILFNLQNHSVSYLLRLYNIIVEPFVKFSQFQHKRDLLTLSEKQMELDEEFELFEKQEINLYCEEVYIVSKVKKCFETVFCNNERLIKALHDSDAFISFDVFDKEINNVPKSSLTCDLNF
ncbi:tRNA (32-2'-O)-methyltransferase regulator THADA [Drosophila tropicalis]|uniref:tRNA (32-2'-O)-methyltransferase regulator THADA n=1 Tax=Drosophila tropicalis TaxID=46794 RepID=UPI0035ABA526